MLMESRGQAFAPADVPPWVSDWMARGAVPAPVVKGDTPSLAAVEAAPDAGPDPKAEARRDAQRVRREAEILVSIRAGLNDLEGWISDQLRGGLHDLSAHLAGRCRQIAAQMVDARMGTLAARVDEIPARLQVLPLAPLLEDLERQQRATRLTPEALPRDLSLDLRTDSGAARSVLLHRLALLDVPWGRLGSAGRSTFRETWHLAWQPELAVALVENLVWGPTIAAAASARLSDSMAGAATLADLAAGVETALTTDLPGGATSGIALLQTMAARTDDASSLLAALPALVDTLRYGTARDIDPAPLVALAERVALQAALALPYAARNLDAAAADAMVQALLAAHCAVALAEFPDALSAAWSSSTHSCGPTQ